jgi:uncharacterized protein (DUF2252 family)
MTVDKTEPFAWLARWEPPTGREPLRVLEAAAVGRDRQLVERRNEDMTAEGDVFTFLRGAAGVMASDLGAGRSHTTGLIVDLCGDAHLGNFGMYGSPERARVFDINDFDEARPGPWEWDVCRLAASAVVTARDRKAGRRRQIDAARAAVTAYAETVATVADGPLIDRWYTMTRCDTPHCRDLAIEDDGDASDPVLARAADLLKADPKRTQAETVAKLTVDGEFHDDDGDQEPIDGKRAGEVRAAYRAYVETVPAGLRRLLLGYEPTAVAKRPVGEGSLGLRNYLLLLRGNGEDDALILQVKEATPSQLEFGLGRLRAPHEGRRVVELQRSLQAASDPLLGWATIGGQQYYVRQYRDMKSAPDLSKLERDDLPTYARLCGTTLARAHARSADGATIAAIGSCLAAARKDFRDAVVAFACTYADVSRDDQALLRDARR